MGLRQRVNQSLLARALLSNFALVGAPVVLLTAVFLLVQFAEMRRQLDLRASLVGHFVATQSEFGMRAGDRTELQRIAQSSLSVEDVLFVVMTDRTGDSIRISRAGFPSGSMPAVPAVEQHPSPALHSGNGQRFLEVVRPVWTHADGKSAARLGTVQIGFSMQQQDRLLSRSLWFAVPAAILSLLLILAVQYAQLRRLLEPLKGLIEFTRQIGRGQLSRRAPVGTLDETGRLAQAFNKMVEELGTITVSKDYVNNIIRSMGESLIVIGPDRGIRTVNHVTLSMLGYTEDELIGRPGTAILSLDEPWDFEESAGVERVFRLKNGTTIPVLFSASQLRGENGAIEGEVWLAQDITLRKVAEERIREAMQQAERANRAKGDLLSRTSHELRTPLNAILGFGQLLQLSELTEQDRDSVGQIMKAGRRLLQLINEVLDVAAIEAGRRSVSKEPVEVQYAAAESLDLVRPLAAARDIEIRCDLGFCTACSVLGDPKYLQRVLLSLLSNAIEYNRPGGAVTLSCQYRPGDRLRIAIDDTGAGILPENIEKLFVPFERLGSAEAGIEGAGLGLAFSKILIEAMGGSIGVDSVVGHGTTFWLDLPVAQIPEDEIEPFVAPEILKSEALTDA
jgi:PAS domain S-box-containing protein